jgi:hypothetical protein
VRAEAGSGIAPERAEPFGSVNAVRHARAHTSRSAPNLAGETTSFVSGVGKMINHTKKYPAPRRGKRKYRYENQSLLAAKGSNGHDEDLSIPGILDRRGEFNGNGRHPPCAQCNADDGQQIQINCVWLHKECKPFWFGER